MLAIIFRQRRPSVRGLVNGCRYNGQKTPTTRRQVNEFRAYRTRLKLKRAGMNRHGQKCKDGMFGNILK
jgi:hypothetical protein